MIYNYKSPDEVQDILIGNIKVIVDDINDEYTTLRRNDGISIYAPSYIALEIISELFNDIDLGYWMHKNSNVNLLFKDEQEVVITIACDGIVFVEDARFDNGKLKNSETSIAYVYDSFKKKDIDLLSERNESILIFGFKDELDECTYCDKLDNEMGKCVEYSEDEDGNMHGFTVSKSDDGSYAAYSFYTTEELSKRDIQSIMQEAGF